MKIIAVVQGGLGNQLFCYAAARALALRNRSELVLDLTSGFIRDSYMRVPQLHCFEISGREATATERLPPPGTIRDKAIRILDCLRPLTRRRYLVQRGCDYDTRLESLKPLQDVYLRGYWQSERYFHSHRTQIRDDLRPLPHVVAGHRGMADLIRSLPSVAIHVRFFDDPTMPRQSRVGLRYYTDAIRMIRQRITSPHFFIFSDDPQRAVAALPTLGSDATIVARGDASHTAVVDLWLMSQCKHFIIADSTFSWWGAWLGMWPCKLVIAPALKRQHGVSAWGFVGLLPEDWTKL